MTRVAERSNGGEMYSKILWVNCVQEKNVCASREAVFQSQRFSIDVRNHHFELDCIDLCRTDFVCFDFDCPNVHQLGLLQQLRTKYLDVPFYMLTYSPSADLAIWAFRSGITDYFLVPRSVCEIEQKLRIIWQRIRVRQEGESEGVVVLPDIPASFACSTVAQVPRTKQAVQYIDIHYGERISMLDMASLCEMDKFAFSRTFKHEQGLCFRTYLQKRRIDEATQLLAAKQHSVTEIALTVGFCDLPNFSRTFKKYYGVSPKDYRAEDPSYF